MIADLEVGGTGRPDGRVLVFHVGTPNAPVAFPLLTDALDERGWQLVAYARPGYAGSPRREGRSVADAAADTAAVLDGLGLDRFVTIGWSGGGPHALACAALLPDRCEAAASLAGVAPFDAEGLHFLAGMGPENVEEFGAAAPLARRARGVPRAGSRTGSPRSPARRSAPRWATWSTTSTAAR